MPRKRPAVPNSHLRWWTVRKAGHAISGNGISRPGYSRHNIILRIDVNGCLFPKQPYSRPRRLRRSPRKVFCTALIHPSQKSRSEEHTSELQSLMRISYAVFCLKKKIKIKKQNQYNTTLQTTNERI